MAVLCLPFCVPAYYERKSHLQHTRLFKPPVHTTPLPQSGYVRLPIALAYTGLSKSTWYEGIKAGRYPKQAKIGLRAVGWDVEDLRRWKESNKKA